MVMTDKRNYTSTESISESKPKPSLRSQKLATAMKILRGRSKK